MRIHFAAGLAAANIGPATAASSVRASAIRTATYQRSGSLTMKIISLLNEKGGVGKSTLAANLATALHRDGKSVILVDADPQGTLRDWRSASPPAADLPPVVALDRPQLLASISSLKAEFIVIDTPAKAEEMAATAIRLSHIALIVIQPSGPDIWASAAAVKLVHRKLDVGGKIDAAFVLNRMSSSTNLSRDVRRGDWNEYHVDAMDSTIGNRVTFARAMTDGLSVFDLPDATAKAEIQLLIAELEAAKWL